MFILSKSNCVYESPHINLGKWMKLFTILPKSKA